MTNPYISYKKIIVKRDEYIRSCWHSHEFISKLPGNGKDEFTAFNYASNYAH